MIASSGLQQQLAGRHDHISGSKQKRAGAPDDTAPASHKQSPAIASSFSFNSYQDILCDGDELELFTVSQRHLAKAANGGANGGGCSQSTFSAPDVKRSLTAANLNAQPRPAYRAQSGGGWSTFANGAKFRVHSRHHSISRLNELAGSRQLLGQTNGAVAVNNRCATNSTCSHSNAATLNLVAQPTPEESQVVLVVSQNKPIKQVQLQHRQQHHHHQQQQQQHQQQPQHRAPQNNKSAERNYNYHNSQQSTSNRGLIMSSGTMQSIQSLSMQLNQAKARGSHSELNVDSGLEEPTLQQNAKSSSSSAGKLGKLVGKKASRVKELVLQNLGKADRTADELFEMYEQNFHKQQAQALRLQKEFKTYVMCMKGVHDAGKSLNSCIQQSTGDYQSARHDLVCENLSQLEHLNEDLLEKLRGQVLVNLTEYLSQFNELKEKIAKRKRKLIDFDSSRRIYELQLVAVNKKRLQLQRAQQQPPGANGQTSGPRSAIRSAFMLGSSSGGHRNQAGNDSLQTATNQLVDEARLLKLREQYNYCKVMYETINSELHDELPMVYEKKMKHLLMSLQNYFSLEAQFHSNASKLFATAGDVIDELPMSVLQAAAAAAAHLHTTNRHQMIRRNSSSLSSAVANVTDTKATSGQVAGYNKPTSTGSSGMGSSRGDSSLDSSSSPDEEAHSEATETSRSPTGENPETAQRDDEEDEVDGEEDNLGGSIKADIHEQPGVESSRDDATGEPAETETDEAGSNSMACVVEPSTGKSVQFEPVAELPADVDGDIEVEPLSSQNKDQIVADQTKLDEQQVDPASGKTGGSETNNKEDICLYKVKTSYKYLAEDVDELCFEADEILQVVEFEPTQEQEEGWLMGVREVNGQRGLFPANFTQPI